MDEPVLLCRVNLPSLEVHVPYIGLQQFKLGPRKPDLVSKAFHVDLL
jgi:hypothetical protein